MILTGIVAMDRNGLIGKGLELPWGRIPADLKRFKSLTMGKPIIMGHRTHESIKIKLPGRLNIVLMYEGFVVSDCVIAGSIPEALAYADGAPETFFIGGAGVYAEALPILDRFYVTRIDREFVGNVHFPDVDWEGEWNLVNEELASPGEGTEWPLVFQTYEWKR